MKILVIFSVLFVMFSCQEGVYSVCGDTCNEWEVCNEKERWCETSPGRCDYYRECGSGEYCSDGHYCITVNNNRCENDGDCADMEECANFDQRKECVLAEGRCHWHGNCNETMGEICLTGGFCGQPCVAFECGNNSTCAVDSDKLETCICDDGYEKKNGACVPVETVCSNVNCSDHGECIIQDDQPICNCADGFEAEGLTCIEVIQCEQPCAEWQECNEVGTCIASEGRCGTTQGCDDGKICSKEHYCIIDPCDIWEEYSQIDGDCHDISGMCENDNDCSELLSCSTEHICSGPCIQGTCSAQQQCRVVEHLPLCCPEGQYDDNGICKDSYKLSFVKNEDAPLLEGGYYLKGWRRTDISGSVFDIEFKCHTSDIECFFFIAPGATESYALIEITGGHISVNLKSDLYFVVDENQANIIKSGELDPNTVSGSLYHYDIYAHNGIGISTGTERKFLLIIY